LIPSKVVDLSMRFARPVLVAVLLLASSSHAHAFRPPSYVPVPVWRTRPLGPTSSISMSEETTPLNSNNSNNVSSNKNRNNNFNFAKAATARTTTRTKSTTSTTTPAYLSRQNPAMGDAAFLRKRTTRLLHVTTNGYETTPMSKKMKVDRKTFNWLIDAWAFSGELDAADNAAALLLRMEELHERAEMEANNNSSTNTNPNICPDVRSYTKVMNAISRSGRPDAGFLAEQLFSKMQTRYSSGKNMAVKPNSYTYTALMEAHANSGDAARAEDVLDMMIDAYATKDHHRDDHGTTTITTISTTTTTIQPTARNFNACISAYAKMGQAMQAEAVFMKMEEHFEHDGNPEAEPNAFHYNSVITAWANCPEEGSAQRAAEVLDRMAYPTTVSYNAVIDAWAKSGVEDAAERAEELLRQMERLYATGANLDAKPNVRSFNSVINVWAKSKREDAAQKAEGVLYYMERLYEGGNEEVRPDVHSFCTVINGTDSSSTYLWFGFFVGLFTLIRSLIENDVPHTTNNPFLHHNHIHLFPQRGHEVKLTARPNGPGLSFLK
jgi:pentatricopeptide repeat protein